MLNIIEWLMKKGFDFTYRYESSYNIIETKEQMVDFLRVELEELAEANEINYTYDEETNIVKLEYSPYVR